MDSLCIVFEEGNGDGPWGDSCSGTALARLYGSWWDITLVVVVSLQISLIC